MLRSEQESALARETWLDRQRYRPQQWSTRGNWKGCDADRGGDTWFGFERVRALEGVSSDIVLVPLVGHTLGHAGVAIRTEHHWMLLAGDAYFFHREMSVDHPYCTPGLSAYQTMMEKDRQSRLGNQYRLRDLRRRHGGEVSIFCSHDVREFERHAGRSAEVPAERMAPAPENILKIA